MNEAGYQDNVERRTIETRPNLSERQFRGAETRVSSLICSDPFIHKRHIARIGY
jgi:hypothetical protein